MKKTSNKKFKFEKRTILYLATYFLVGLIFNIPGLIGGGLWLKFKNKTFGKQKLISLLCGFSLFIFLVYAFAPTFIQPLIDKSFYSQYPEVLAVKQAIEKKYPLDNKFVGVRTNIRYFDGKATETSLLYVEYESSERLKFSKMRDIAKITCSVLESKNKKYDKVQIISSYKIFYIFSGTFYFSASCKDWETKDFSNLRIP